MALAQPLATDEDIAVRAAGDYAELCPRGQRLADGTDGVIAAGSWVLISPSITSWAAQGVAVGGVVRLVKGTGGAIASRSIDQLFAVDGLSGASLTLRRCGLTTGIGSPPGGSTGYTAIEFLVATLSPQIEDASYELDHRYGIDDAISGRRNADLYDARQFRQLCVLTVLARQYAAMAQNASQSQKDALWAKYGATQGELNDAMDRLAVLWVPAGGNPGNVSPPTTKFSMRISR